MRWVTHQCQDMGNTSRRSRRGVFSLHRALAGDVSREDSTTIVLMALEPDANISELCREHGISRKTAYKWLERFKARGVQGLEDLSKRPHSSPLRASGEMVLQVLELRAQHPRWGPKKLHKVLSQGDAEIAPASTAAADTCGAPSSTAPRSR